ncbi:hypothetical protein [Streptomyces formicae]|uniref:Uncharacterized protein n=1 Tax=Streptomyces formicae TaxID=1616117 RepID=A0A291Q7K6_9ACTN|nr:hypothetical protein [Streptomyces formicae]ATL27770.1 hypothetical protein KY5_2752c [Streptomyces formicae]
MSSSSTLFSGDVDVSYCQLYVVSDPDGWGDIPYDPFSGQTSGLCGAAVPGYLHLSTGLHTGPVGCTVELHETEPALDESWEEITEVSFRPVSAGVSLELWGGDGSFPLGLDLLDYRVRHHVSGMDEARERELECLDGLVVERHLLQFWPAPPARDRLIKQTGSSAAYSHERAGKLPEPPTPEQLAEAERLAREQERRAAEERHLRRLKDEWGGQLPSTRLLEVGGNVAGIRELAPELAHALDRLGPDRQRAVARWAARRAYEKAGLTDVGWIVPALAAAERGQPLPAPFDAVDDHASVWERLFGDPDVPDTIVPSTDGRIPNMRQQAMAIPALYGAVEDDPLRAALDALYAAAVTYGPAYDTLFAEARSAFSGELGPSANA